jgi:hypothetical protein
MDGRCLGYVQLSLAAKAAERMWRPPWFHLRSKPRRPAKRPHLMAFLEMTLLDLDDVRLLGSERRGLDVRRFWGSDK